MQVLQLCNKPPFPPVDGGCIAMHQLSKALHKSNHNVRVLAMETYKHPVLVKNDHEHWLEKTNQTSVFVDIKVQPFKAFLNLFTSKSYNVERFRSKTFEHKLIELLSEGNYDVIICESLFTTLYHPIITKYSKAKIIYRAHNIEQKIWWNHYQNQKGFLIKWYFKLLYRRIKKFELNVLKNFNSIAAISKDEEKFFKNVQPGINVQTIPIYFQPKPTVIYSPGKDLSLFHIGSMDWKPNQDGIKWFLDKVWPVVLKRNKFISLHLAGRSMPDWLSNLNRNNVEIHGKVADAGNFIDKYDLMIVPIFSASGIRIKILEAMARGKVVICTTTAAQGINYTNNKCLLIADNDEEFINTILAILDGKINLEEISKNALHEIEKEHSEVAAINNLKLLLA